MRALPHGYTNATLTDGRVVVKTYRGPDMAARQAREELAMRRLADLLPVPTLLASTPDSCTTAWAPGVPGQEAIDAGHAAKVLRACGVLLAELQRIDPSVLFEGALFEGKNRATLVHNDFGPNNVLMRPDLSGVQLLCDWEWVAAGDPVTDLAWAEWIVRAHHPDALSALPALFDGYGHRPPWPMRSAAMTERALRHRDFVRQWPGAAGNDVWDQRLAAIATWREIGG